LKIKKIHYFIRIFFRKTDLIYWEPVIRSSPELDFWVRTVFLELEFDRDTEQFFKSLVLLVFRAANRQNLPVVHNLKRHTISSMY
jgi:hypothetical protein